MLEFGWGGGESGGKGFIFRYRNWRWGNFLFWQGEDFTGKKRKRGGYVVGWKAGVGEKKGKGGVYVVKLHGGLG